MSAERKNLFAQVIHMAWTAYFGRGPRVSVGEASETPQYLMEKSRRIKKMIENVKFSATTGRADLQNLFFK